MIKTKYGWEDIHGELHSQAEMDRNVVLQNSKYEKRYGYNKVYPCGKIWLTGDCRHTIIAPTEKVVV